VVFAVILVLGGTAFFAFRSAEDKVTAEMLSGNVVSNNEHQR
jgi:hypothetical protein